MHPTLSPLSARLATHIVDIPTLPMTVSPVLFAKAPLFWPPDSTVLFRTRISPMHAIGSPCIHTAPVDVDAWLTHAVSHVGRWPTSARRASRLIRCASFMGFSASAWRGRVTGVALTLATVTLPPVCTNCTRMAVSHASLKIQPCVLWPTLTRPAACCWSKGQLLDGDPKGASTRECSLVNTHVSEQLARHAIVPHLHCVQHFSA
jgi:hypothetical protein